MKISIMELISNFEQLTKEDISLAGGKGANLGEPPKTYQERHSPASRKLLIVQSRPITALPEPAPRTSKMQAMVAL